jgi:monoamine oxidase
MCNRYLEPNMLNASLMFANVPSKQPSLRAAYEAWLKARSALPKIEKQNNANQLKVGIVGAGMAGLYAALLLKSRGIDCHLYEAHPTRLGGRVYTHRFNNEPNQYFEAGAMRLPETPEQQPVFDLISFLNEQSAPESNIELIPYNLYDTNGNLVYVNGKRAFSGATMTLEYANQHPEALGFKLPPDECNKTASQLLDEVLQPFFDQLEVDFDLGFAKIVQYDNYSLYTYLTEIAGWSMEKVNYVEVMTSATNQFHSSFTELVIESMDFSGAKWRTIANGMDRLPNACAQLIGEDAISMNTPVRQIENLADGRVAVHYGDMGEFAIFDRVIMAIPPAALRMIDTPQWSPTKMQAIRAMHYEPLYKIGLRFKTRFWEQLPQPAMGGQSATDLPMRWCVYPSYGLGDSGAGVLLLYSWMSDAYNWLPQSQEERVRLALRDLQTLYQDTVDIEAEFIESYDVAWPSEWATGDAMFFPGQFRQLFNNARQPEQHIYFAGEHLSVHHTWIVGALDSALLACQQLLGDDTLGPLRARAMPALSPHQHDYSKCAAAPILQR